MIIEKGAGMKISIENKELLISDFNAIEAYKIACSIEKDGISFYTRLRADEKNVEVAQTLDFLIEEEERHLKVFQERLAQLQNAEEDDFEDDDLFACIDYGIFEPYESIENLAEYLDDIKKALRLGIKAEDNAVSFYKACLAGVSSESAKLELEKIIDEEIKHKKILADILGG